MSRLTAEEWRRARDYIEWDWAYSANMMGQALHHLASVDAETWDEGEGVSGTGTSTCGQTRLWRIPGLISRMGMARCVRCCDKLGIKRGIGSPKNDPELRPWVESRLPVLHA